MPMLLCKMQRPRNIYQKGTNIFLMCRVCLTQSSSAMYDLNDEFEIDSGFQEKVLLIDALQKVTSSRVVLNGIYPQYICPMCTSLLKMSFKFIEQYEESELKLREVCNIADDQVSTDVADSVHNIEFDENLQAPVEVIYNNRKFSLNELLVVEATENEKTNFKGFLKNLGKEISATFVGRTRKGESTRNDVDDESKVSVLVKDNNRILPIKELQLDEDANLINYIVDESVEEDVKIPQLEDFSGENSEYIELDIQDKDAVESLIIERESGTEDRNRDKANISFTRHFGKRQKEYDDINDDIFEREIKFPCEICGRIFSTNRLLQAHKRRTHFSQTRHFTCEICGYVNNTRSAYMNHKLKHAGKQFVCEICYKPYYTKAVLKVHMETHMNSRQHLCSVCGKSFNYANALVYHMRLHTGEKNYQCKFCDKKFRMPNSLHRHIRVHTGEKPFPCRYCDKAFRSRGEVSCHENIHTGFRPYHCKYCDKGFIKTNNLKLHLLSHDGPHQCDLCDKSFIEMTILGTHYKIAHKNMLPRSDDEDESGVY